MENCKTLNIFFADIVTNLKIPTSDNFASQPFDNTDNLSVDRITDKYKNHSNIITVKQFCKENFCSFQFVEKNFVLNKKRSLNVTKSAQEIDKII